MDILDFIFTNISLQVYTVVATVIFTILYYLIVIFLIKFYSSDEESENYRRNNGIHIIVKIFVFYRIDRLIYLLKGKVKQ